MPEFQTVLNVAMLLGAAMFAWGWNALKKGETNAVNIALAVGLLLVITGGLVSCMRLSGGGKSTIHYRR
jgi:hypothetical protein